MFTLLLSNPAAVVHSAHSASLCTQAVYHHDYVHSIRGKVAPTTKTVDLDRALHAYKLQSEVRNETWTECPAEIQDSADEGQASVEVASAWASSAFTVYILTV